MTLPRRYWHEMTTGDFAGLPAERVIAVLPVAAIEQHGPHLPVYVDACIVDGVVKRALELAPADLPVTVLPTQAVGKSNEHLAFAGTLTLGAETLTRLWTEIGESVARAGVRKLVLFNAHGGQPQIMDIVARDLRVRLNMLAVSASWYGFGLPDGLFPPEEVRFGIHGGAVETSMMLHLRPDLVRLDKLRNFVSEAVKMAREFKLLRPTGPVAFAWQTQDLNPEGACGDATNSDAARGAKVIDFAAAKFVELLQDIDRFPLTALRMR
ncbi:MAG: creatininase family protein [Proteobacteria bacterium]|nr:creatininase family protein [Pseudomonadota bacterium]